MCVSDNITWFWYRFLFWIKAPLIFDKRKVKFHNIFNALILRAFCVWTFYNNTIFLSDYSIKKGGQGLWMLLIFHSDALDNFVAKVIW